MTWGQFKAAVEAAGVKDDHQLVYIDWNYEHGEADELDVDIEPPSTGQPNTWVRIS